MLWVLQCGAASTNLIRCMSVHNLFGSIWQPLYLHHGAALPSVMP